MAKYRLAIFTDSPPGTGTERNTNGLLRGHLLSKLSQLKQEAYQAGKKRDWDRAVSVYEKILEIDKNNPMVINEMGDLCLKAGDTPRSVRHFLSAASRYRTTGLLNNAVAIYKKILRYEPDNQSAHWYLSETRASQGLLVEGEEHAIRFLENSERVSGDIKEIFLKRCLQLFELYADSKPILDKLLLIFRMWNMALESARTNCLLACFKWDAGEEDEARTAMTEIAAKVPEIRNYLEYQRLSGRIDPGSKTGAASSADVHAISFDTVEPPVVEVEPEPEVAPAAEEIPAVGQDETSFGGLAPEIPDTPGTEESPETAESPKVPEAGPPDIAAEIDDEGCFALNLDDDLGGSIKDLVAQAASGLDDLEDTADQAEEVTEIGADGPDADAGADESAPGAEKVDLLAQILAEDDGSLARNESSQLEAIAEDIGTQVGGAEGDQDPTSQYEMGMVYLDMGLYDQSVASFQKAGADPEFAVRSCEMVGITLLKAQRPAEAIDALKLGLETTQPGSKENLGLRYYLAQAYEQNQQDDEAIAQYQEIQLTDPGFLDVNDRLATLSRV